LKNINNLWKFIKNNGGTLVIILTIITSIYTIGIKVESFNNDVIELKDRVNQMEQKLDKVGMDNRFFVNFLQKNIEDNISKQAYKIKYDKDDIKEVDIVRAIDDFSLLDKPSAELIKNLNCIKEYYDSSY